MLNQKQKKDNLTKLELLVYGCLCYGSTVGVFICIYFAAKATTENLRLYSSILGFVFLAITGVFGLGIQHDTRVLNLRRFKK